MDQQDQQKLMRSPKKLSWLSLVLGFGAWGVLVLGIFLGIFVEVIGITSFFTPVMLLGLLGAYFGIQGRNLLAHESSRLAVRAKHGIYLGVGALMTTLVLRVLVFLFFILWLKQ